MPDNRHTNLLRTIVELYRNHWRLFWCIMLPVAICSMAWFVAQTIFLSKQMEESMIELNNLWTESPSRASWPTSTIVSYVSTADGAIPTLGSSSTDPAAHTKNFRTTWQLYPIPDIKVDNNAGIIWQWGFGKVGGFYYDTLFVLMIAFCPLSLAVARILREAQAEGHSPPTAREIWRQTSRKAFPVFIALILFMLIVDGLGTFFGVVFVLVPWLIPALKPSLDSIDALLAPYAFHAVWLTFVVHYYFLVTLSLYNPCLILENNTIIGVFRRSHALARGARWRFFKIYFLTGWITATIASVLVGIALLILSVFIPVLAPMREVLFPFQFLLLFVGGDVTVALPEILSLPAMAAVLVVKGLIITALVPIWVILTTLLYLKRVDATEKAAGE